MDLSDDEIDNEYEKRLSQPLSQRLAQSQSDSKRLAAVPKEHKIFKHVISDSEDSDQEHPSSNHVSLDKCPVVANTTNEVDEDWKFSCSLSSDEEQETVVLIGSEVKCDVAHDLHGGNTGIIKPSHEEEEDKEILISPKKKRRRAKVLDEEKERKKIERLKQQEMKKQEKLLEKALKDAEREAKRNTKPEECLKSMRLCIDDCMTGVSESEVLFNVLLDNEVKYSLDSNHVPFSFVWYRKITDVIVVENSLQRNEYEQLEPILLLYFPSVSFLDLVHASTLKRKNKPVMNSQTLLERICELKVLFPKMELTLITVGLDSYLRNKKAKVGSNGVTDDTSELYVKCVSKKDVDEAVVELQIQAFVNYVALDDMTKFGNLLARYTKAVAEAPVKKERYEQQEKLTWYAQADSSGPVKIGKDGDGFTKLWRQQIQQFNSIGKEVAEAIASKYPLPGQLVEAYKHCTSQKEAIKLLQDIIVRREFGPLGTTRRVGPELSYKIYRLFTSEDGNELLQR